MIYEYKISSLKCIPCAYTREYYSKSLPFQKINFWKQNLAMHNIEVTIKNLLR